MGCAHSTEATGAAGGSNNDQHQQQLAAASTTARFRRDSHHDGRRNRLAAPPAEEVNHSVATAARRGDGASSFDFPDLRLESHDHGRRRRADDVPLLPHRTSAPLPFRIPTRNLRNDDDNDEEPDVVSADDDDGNSDETAAAVGISYRASLIQRATSDDVPRRTSDGSRQPRLRTQLQHPLHLSLLSPSSLHRSNNTAAANHESATRSRSGSGGRRPDPSTPPLGATGSTFVVPSAAVSGDSPSSMGVSVNVSQVLSLNSENLALHLQTSTRRRQVCEVYAVEMPEELKAQGGRARMRDWLAAVEAPPAGY